MTSDARRALSVIQAGSCDGDQLGTRPDVGRGVAFFERFIRTVRAPNGRKPTNHRHVLNGIFWIARTGFPRRDLPDEFGKWSSVYRQFRRWTLVGLWELRLASEMSLVIGTPDGRNRLGGMMIATALFASVPHEFTGRAISGHVAAGFTILGLICFAPQIKRSRQVFLVIALALVGVAAATLPGWGDAVFGALSRASFIAALFTALAAIRSAAITDPGIIACGRFLAGQLPGRRYLALTLGGHLFGLVLLYGAISLLGGLATESTADEADDEIRRIRTRRMLVAIQRGFVSTLMWSPLSFCMAITLSVVPGANWARSLPLCALDAVGLAGLGWALDSLFKPGPSPTPPPRPHHAEGAWLRHLRPLYILLDVILILVGAIHFAADVRIFGAVMGVVPLIALAWTTLQPTAEGNRIATAVRRAKTFALRDVPELNGELTLLIMAGFIGALGASVAAPFVQASGLDLTAIPTTVRLVAVFWTIPLTGQLGMNPILAVSLLGPLLPSPEVLGIAPAVMVFAITGGWALSGATSPYTALVLLVGAYGKVGATQLACAETAPMPSPAA